MFYKFVELFEDTLYKEECNDERLWGKERGKALAKEEEKRLEIKRAFTLLLILTDAEKHRDWRLEREAEKWMVTETGKEELDNYIQHSYRLMD
ncbi:unnamed protein product [Allacma fusca]|uniref:Uncharacterized protein n=1 Tax=Allacma fusca TaxID=39272 RepID=A0A8J2J5C3_9HEXA|nr:unnamed protein product [Allacma fusca]